MIGTTVSHYRILEKLGEGGMGIVYKAQDINLDRFVAIKQLPPGILASTEERERLQAEAKALSVLNHPNIATIHEFVDSGDQGYIVMEYIRGGSLRTLLDTLRTSRSQLPLEKVLQYGVQIAEGLSHAHRHSIIHRDIKPDNIMLSEEGDLKITDFGLAKLRGSRNLTKRGSTVGTTAYMAPEQIRGEEADHRSDVFSLGIVLFELATTSMPFRGDHDAAISYSIVNESPGSPADARPDIPPALVSVIARCLEKDPGKRFQSAREVADALKQIQQQQGRPAQDARPRRRLFAVAGSLLLFTVAVYLFVLSRRGQNSSPLNITLTQVTTAEGIEEYPAWSPDGTRMAYCAEVGGLRKIFVNATAGGQERQLTHGQTDDIQPAWSPDNQSIVFVRSQRPDRRLDQGDVFGQFDNGDLWTVDLATGAESRLVANAFNPSFSPTGQQIAFDASWGGPRRIWITDKNGTNPRQVSSDTSEAVVHVIPHWSPDGGRIVFQNIERTVFDIKFVDVRTGRTGWITHDLFLDVNPVWSPSGKYVYFSSYRSGGLNIWRALVPSDDKPSGVLRQITTGAGEDVEIAVSTDGKRLAFANLKQNADIWRLPVSALTGKTSGQPEELIATTREDSRGAWSPDGSTIAFNSDRGTDMNIWIHSLNGGATRQLTKGPGGDYQPNWSPDGKTLAFFSSRSGNADIWSVDVGSGALKQLTTEQSLEINPFYSPDGHSIAYQSDAGGRLEPWIMRSDGSERKKLADMPVSGHFMRWSKDGTSLYFRSPNPFQPGDWSVPVAGGSPKFVMASKPAGHMSFSPSGDLMMDLYFHKELWVLSLATGAGSKVFEFADPSVRIDYPVWSPDGKWVLFDRVKPQGGDIWMIEDFE